MIDRALLYLLAMRLKNNVRRLLAQPGRLALLVVALGLFATVAFRGGSSEGMSDAERRALLGALLSFNLLLSVVTGLGENGLGFSAADLDHVFPAPFSRRAVLGYHLLRHYAGIFLLGLLYTAFLGLGRIDQPVLAYLGVVLCLAVCTHLQVASTLLAATLGDVFFGRLKRVARVLLAALLGTVLLLAVVAIREGGEVALLVRDALASGPARVLLFPAVEASEAAFETTVARALPHLLYLLLAVVGTFAVTLAFRVNFLETSFATTRRAFRRATGRLEQGGMRRRSARNAPSLLRGAGGVAWLNAITLMRRPRLVVGSVILLALLLLVSRTRPGQALDTEMPRVVPLLAFFALMSNVPLGFRGHREHLPLLKTLPVSPFGLALGEVAVPALLVLGLQLVVLLGYVAAKALDPAWVLVGAAAYPVLDVGVVTLVELFQIGRDPRSLGLLATMLQLVALVTALLPAIVAGAMAHALFRNLPAAIGAAVVAQAAVDVLLLKLLAARFARFDVSSIGV